MGGPAKEIRHSPYTWGYDPRSAVPDPASAYDWPDASNTGRKPSVNSDFGGLDSASPSVIVGEDPGDTDVIEDVDEDEDFEDSEDDESEDDDEYDNFIDQCMQLIPDAYEYEGSEQSIILRYHKEMSHLGGIIARLTSSYR